MKDKSDESRQSWKSDRNPWKTIYVLYSMESPSSLEMILMDLFVLGFFASELNYWNGTDAKSNENNIITFRVPFSAILRMSSPPHKAPWGIKTVRFCVLLTFKSKSYVSWFANAATNFLIITSQNYFIKNQLSAKDWIFIIEIWIKVAIQSTKITTIKCVMLEYTWM